MNEFLDKYKIQNTSELYSYVMYCESDTEVLLDDESIQKIKSLELETENE